MTIAQIGIKGNNAVIPYVATTKATKQVALTVMGTNWTTIRAIGVAYADSAGAWRLKFNIKGSLSSAASVFQGTVTGVVFKSVGAEAQAQAISVKLTEYGAADMVATENFVGTGTSIFQVSAAANFNRILVSGDVELNAEPTWAAANMEGAIAADVYIAPASTTPGLLTYYSTKTYTGKFKGDNSSAQSADVTMVATKIGNVVTLTLPVITITSNASDSYLLNDTMSVLDIEYRPATELRLYAAQIVATGSVLAAPGTIVVYDTGLLRIYRDSGGTAYGNGDNSGLRNRIGITYHV